MRIVVAILLIVSVTFISCEKSHLSFRSVEKRLTKRTWQVDSYVDHTLNECHDPLNTEYIFEENGQFLVVKPDTSYHTIWSLDNDKKYITIGNNTFKLVLVTSNILSLRYGDVDIFYIPSED